MIDKEYLSQCSERYKADLKGNIMPFWIEKGLDPVYGGVYTCLDRQGNIMDTTKSVWFQGRFGFIGSFAFNNIEKTRSGSTPRAVVSSLSRPTAPTPRTDACILK